ncbi:MAG: MBL fold metallo-hydrolase [Dermatophilaceae bacterium]|nr:MBL fold metallo-hydrolase [Intrasporangiaceae bacterium]
MRLTFLGVRGSTPAPGADFVRYGGHTSCVAVAADADSEPLLVLDAGTGIRLLTGLLAPNAFTGSILISHLHWDHVQGIPFFAAGDRADARADVYVPAESGLSGRDLVAKFMSPPSFPITPEGMKGEWTFTAVEPEPLVVEGFDVVPFEVSHKGGRTFGYRISNATGSFAYVPDHAPAAGVSDAAIEAMRDVDVLIHDAQFLDHERPRAVDYGHATITEALALADRVGARSLVLFHHGPHRTDAALDQITAEFNRDGFARTAHEGMTLDLG